MASTRTQIFRFIQDGPKGCTGVVVGLWEKDLSELKSNLAPLVASDDESLGYMLDIRAEVNAQEVLRVFPLAERSWPKNDFYAAFFQPRSLLERLSGVPRETERTFFAFGRDEDPVTWFHRILHYVRPP